MSAVLYASGPVVKRRWWACRAKHLGQDRDDYVLAPTRSKARYSYWLDVKDVRPDVPIMDIVVQATDRLPVYERKVMPKPIRPPRKERRTLTRVDWLAEAKRLFPGKTSKDWRCTCPSCGESQSMAEFVEAGMTQEEAQSRSFFSCIGRWVKGRGCDWTLGGLFTIHSTEVLDEEGVAHPVFEFDTPPQDPNAAG